MAYNNKDLLLLTILSVGWVGPLLVSPGLTYSCSYVQLEVPLG